MNTNPAPSQSNYQEEEQVFDIKKYLFLILGNWYWFFFCFIICVAIAYFVNRYSQPQYQVSASLILKDEATKTSGIESVIPGADILRTQKKVLNEMEVLRSYSLTSRAIEKLDFNVTYVGIGRSGLKSDVLYHSCPYRVITDSSDFNLVNHPVYIKYIDKTKCEIKIDGKESVDKELRFGEKFKSPDFNFTVILKDSASFDPNLGYYKNYFYFNTHNAIVNQYRSKLKIAVNDEKRGSVLFLNVNGPNAEQEVTYLNTLIHEYILKGLEEKNQTAVNTVIFIDNQLGILNDSLKGAELTLQNFRLNNKLFDISEKGQLVSERLEKLTEEKSMLRLQQRYFDYLIEYVQNRNNLNQAVAPSTVGINDPLLTGLITDLNQLIAQKAELSVSLQQNNPKASIVSAQVESARQALLDLINNLIKNNRIALTSNEKLISESDKELEHLPVTERKLIGIQREYKVNDQIYTYLLQKRAEAAIARASNVSDNNILDYAMKENAVMTSPKIRMNYMMGLTLGLLIPLVIILLLEMFNNKITDRSEIEKRTQTPIVGTVGHYLGSNTVAVHENPRSSLAESFRAMRTNLQYLLKDHTKKVITVTSTITGEGKTFTSINLAAIFALAGKKTLLVGLDLRKPKIFKAFGFENKKGVSTYLLGRDRFEDILYATGLTNLFATCSGPIPPNPAELIGSQEMSRFVEEAREKFDIVIIDTPPFAIVTDASIIGQIADVNLFVVRQMYSMRDVIDAIDKLYRKQDYVNMGIVLNDVKPTGYYYHSGYRAYNYGYGNYYDKSYYSDNDVIKDNWYNKLKKLFKLKS